MEGLNRRAQWIVLMGLIVSIALIFLAIVINESALVGQTTAESVLDFPKEDIKDVRAAIVEWKGYLDGGGPDSNSIRTDIEELELQRNNAVVYFDSVGTTLTMHYNNGVTRYDETVNT
jgi:hypothetical protein